MPLTLALKLIKSSSVIAEGKRERKKSRQDCLEYTVHSVQIRRCLNVDIWGPYSNDHPHHLYCLLVTEGGGGRGGERMREDGDDIIGVGVYERDEMEREWVDKDIWLGFPRRARRYDTTPSFAHRSASMASGWCIYPARNTEKRGRRGRKKNQSINELIRAAFRVVRWVSEGKKRITTVIVNTLVCVCLFIDHFGKLNIQGHRSMEWG